MESRNNSRRGRDATPAGAASCSPDNVLQWAWAEACALLACGENPNTVSLSELKRRFCRDLRENSPNLMVYTDPRCRVVKTDRRQMKAPGTQLRSETAGQ